MTVMTERVVLDYWNGRPTEVLFVQDGEPYLRWLVLGQAGDEPEIWLMMHLTWEQAERIGEPGSLDLHDLVASSPGAEVQISFESDGDKVAHVWTTSPGGPSAVAQILRALSIELSKLVNDGSQFDAEARRAISDIAAIPAA